MAKLTWMAISSWTAIVLMAASVVAQSPRPSQSREPVRLVGCLLRDSAGRQARPAGGTSTAELLLVTTTTAGSAVAGATATAGGAAAGRTSFALSGGPERQLVRHVGHPVEIVGTIDADDLDQQQPTGGVTDPVSGAGSPPGAPVSLNGATPSMAGVQRLNIISAKPLGGACR